MEQRATYETFSVETPESVAFAFELAGLGSRGIALALDMLIIGLVMLAEAALTALVLLGYALATRAVGDAGPRVDPAALSWALGILVVVAFATYWGYFVYGEVARNGRTWGKGRVGIRVVRDDGSRVGFLDSVIRNLLRLADILPGNYAVGMGCILFTRKHKRLGDMAAGTVVVRDRGELSLDFDGGEHSRQTELAREFLKRRASLTPAAREQVAAEVLRAFGEEPHADWSEEIVAGRIADLSGARPKPPPAAPRTEDGL